MKLHAGNCHWLALKPHSTEVCFTTPRYLLQRRDVFHSAEMSCGAQDASLAGMMRRDMPMVGYMKRFYYVPEHHDVIVALVSCLCRRLIPPARLCGCVISLVLLAPVLAHSQFTEGSCLTFSCSCAVVVVKHRAFPLFTIFSDSFSCCNDTLCLGRGISSRTFSDC